MSALQTIGQFFRPWGWTASACGALLAAAAALNWGPGRYWQQAAAQAFEQSSAEQLLPSKTRHRGGSLVADPRLELPAADELNRRLAALIELTRRHGLRAGDTVLSHQTGPIAGIERRHVALPLQGSYANLRAYVEAALAADAALSLDGLRLSRAQVDAGDLKAELVWALHGRAAPAGKP